MFKRIFGVVAMAAALGTTSALAQEPADVVATVNGDPVTMADVAFAYATLGDTMSRVPPEQRQEMVTNLVIDMHVLADAAKKAGYDEDPDYQHRLAYLTTQALREIYMDKVINPKITEDAVHARYDEEVANMGSREEVSASHILVSDEDKAKELIKEIEGGADFAKLAQENSQDPGSAQRGGSLGFFGKGQMVPEFEAAAFALEPGEVTTEPVKSQFGWHIIKLDDKRIAEIPPYDQVKDQIRQIMTREAYVQEVARLKENATIERTTPQDAQ
ncbi:peptidylprolyl isomerase [Acuticoccus mangrovi]|uniref:Parvulin-like PPIase n=1 Tax=Acuticoccus mangrovi TaxID=2796142 RepID=A0A934IQF1_9HYPH|nr:peptidylprolyl isomerase [Acuticoccus mangrovi]MBJ3775719.1 peptidylprolyl isomerase [Acuticoccus mangrovi]